MKPTPAALFMLAAAAAGNAPAFAQARVPPPPLVSSTPPVIEPHVRLGTRIDAGLLGDLPGTGNLFALIETVEPSMVSDRFSAGGLFEGQAARVGGFLGSWSQTSFFVDDVDVTDPTGSGMPLLFPDLLLWRQVDLAVVRQSDALNTTGLAVALTPARAGLEWARTIRVTTSHFGTTSGDIRSPPIARLGSWDRAELVASGPLFRRRFGPDRVGAVFVGAWSRASQYARAEPAPAAARMATTFAHLVFAPDDQNEVRTIGWFNRVDHPFEHRTAFAQPGAAMSDASAHVQSAWERRSATGLPFRLLAGYTQRNRKPDYASGQGVVLERLRDGPMEQLASIAESRVRQWSLGGRIAPPFQVYRGQLHRLQAGAEIKGAQAHLSSFFSGAAGELVDGASSRIWVFSAPGTPSRRTAVMVGAHVTDRVELSPRLTVDGGLRFDSAAGSADGASGDIRWRTWLPRASIRWIASDGWRTSLFAGYDRSAYRLALDLLAIGDPAAPTADVFRWDDQAPSRTPLVPPPLGVLVARGGPGTAGRSGFTVITPDLKRPYSDSIVIGIIAAPVEALRFRLAGVARRERNLIALANPGVPPSAYTTFMVADPGGDVGDPSDDRVLTVYNRTPASFGADRYELTNAEADEATFKGIELTFAYASDAFTLMGGATAGMAIGPAAGRGFGPIDNDQSIPGERLTSPNASALAEGRLFTDRAYTAKIGGVYRFPRNVRLGAIARYQDGQPFARVLVVRDLNQGAEAVRAFTNGESRFRFTGTLDIRLQKGFSAGRGQIHAVLDAYNLLDLRYEVEERAAQAPDARVGTAVQPPRAVHVGVRVEF